jgi:hypothetical protein
MSRKVLYGPNDNYLLQSKFKSKPKDPLAKCLMREFNDETHISKPRLSLRRLASYKFIFYFFIVYMLTKSITGYSSLLTFFIVSLLFLLYHLYQN